jgi:hypothetical protein
MSVALSLRARLLALILLALLPAFVLIIFDALQHNRRTAADVKSTARRFAVQNHGHLIDNADDLLPFLSRLPLPLLDPQACPALFANLSRRSSNFVNFLVIDLRGSVICSTEAGKQSAKTEIA